MNHEFPQKKCNNSNTPPCHQNCAINTFFSSLHRSASNDSSSASIFLLLSLLLSLCKTVYRLHLCFHYTALFSIAGLKLCLAVCHHSALLPKQPESVDRLLRLILCSVSCQTVMLRKLVDLENSWQPSQILDIKTRQVDLEINTNHPSVVIVL